MLHDAVELVEAGARFRIRALSTRMMTLMTLMTLISLIGRSWGGDQRGGDQGGGLA